MGSMRKRPSARLLVLDPYDRLLLFLFDHRSGPLAGTAFWATPGGGLDAAESYPDAARRELFEETGIKADVGEAVAVRHVEFMMPHGEMVTAEEHYFLVRHSGAIDLHANPDPVEQTIVTQARWWTLPEIRAATVNIYPENIVEMVKAAIGRA
jgi:8-oxo-dGTP pyrophosphatase MutT (NUDIX family)